MPPNIEGRTEVTGKRERRYKQLPDDLKEKTGNGNEKGERYNKFEKDWGAVLRQATE